MKTNGNNFISKPYFLGLDIGTDSVGLAVTDTTTNYNILKYKGNLMQSVRLFDAANDSKERRSARTNRRRLNRRKQRLELLEQLFYSEISKTDPTFFIRLKNSFYQVEDKNEILEGAKYTLFNDDNFNDAVYIKKYPSVYHLRNELIKSKEPHDIRLVYLAIHHILKKRGHFLFDTSSDTDISTAAVLDELSSYIEQTYGVTVNIDSKVESILSNTDLNISTKKKELKLLVSFDDNSTIDCIAMTECLAGASVDLSKLFNNDLYIGTKIKLADDLDEKYDELVSIIGDEIDLIVYLKKVFDTARLTAVLGNHIYICESKCALYNKNKEDLKTLRCYVKQNYPEKYKQIFCEKKKGLNNYSAYSRNKVSYICKQEDFCKYLKTTLNDMANDQNYSAIWKEITEGTFLTRLSDKNNGLIPNQLHRKELVKILENASDYLPFLNYSDDYGTIKDKILNIFDFKVPYYVGPLNSNSKTGWIQRKDEKIYPWNFKDVVDVDACAQSFMKNLIGKCEYTGDEVLPKNSLIYSEYALLNELNPIKVNGTLIPTEVKNEIVHELFKESKRKVTKKQIHSYLLKKGYIKNEDIITGIDDNIKSNLKSFHDFRDILEKYENEKMVEDIIQGILVYGEDKKLLKRWLKKNYSKLTKDEINYISRLKYKDWGRLSRTLLCEIYSPDENGEAHSIIDMLRSTNMNLMQLLSTDYMFKENSDAYFKEHHSCDIGIKKRLDEMYISPSTRRAVLQALKMTDEIVDIMHGAPEKIFIEVAREHDPERGRTLSRKDQLIKLYEECGEKDSEIYDKLINTDELKLRGTALYLYYKQMGKCMYSGENIDLDHLTDKSYYDIDHIYPQSKVLDDSLENKVLVTSVENRKKADNPISSEVRDKMASHWSMLKSKGFLSEKKYSRLVRSTPLDEKELSAFVNRQIVETQQSTKAVATLFKEMYGEAGTKIVYSKAGNVTRFRHEFDLIKCREINDLHHAKDAYLNIVVGNVIDTKFTEKFFKNITNENYSLNRIFDYDVPGAWVGSKTKTDNPVSIHSVKTNYYKNSVRYTRMPKEVKGAISKATIYPKGIGQLPIKHGLDIEKYGGYSDVKGAYFCLVEHTLKKKRVRTLEPVYIHLKEKYEKNPTEYCTDCLKLQEPIVVEKKILIESLIELDGKRYHITGRSVDVILAKHPYQLVLDNFSVQYIREISEYIEKCSERKTIIDHVMFKVGNKTFQINKENNIKLYEILLDKLHSAVYQKLLKNIESIVYDGKNVFENHEVYKQCVVLLNILKAFKCDRQVSDLTIINGKKTSGTITFNKNISNCNTAYLISQSPTGLFEYKKDLLREI